jgi:hypothetical protein
MLWLLRSASSFGRYGFRSRIQEGPNDGGWPVEAVGLSSFWRFRGKADITNPKRHVRFWHKADIPMRPINVRYWG